PSPDPAVDTVEKGRLLAGEKPVSAAQFHEHYSAGQQPTIPRLAKREGRGEGVRAIGYPSVTSMNAIAVSVLGNAYESTAVALSNLRSRPATYRLVCEPFQSGTNRVAAREVLTLHEVLSVRPDGTGELTEDPLPLLGEGQ